MVSNEEPTFTGQHMYVTAKDRETLYWLVQESQITPDEKQRLCNKLSNQYVSDETYKKAQKLHKRRGNAQI